MAPFMQRFTHLVSTRAWPWSLPLIFLVMPIYLAWNHCILVPHADAWFMSFKPYIKMLQGTGSLWEFIHAPGNDSRHDVPHLFNWIVFRFFGGDLRVESLLCVMFSAFTATMLLWLIRCRLSGPVLWRYLAAWLTVGHILSPFQWMNWSWGVQICYAVVVWGSIGALTVMQVHWPLIWRTLAACFCAVAATLSFLNGWFSWGLIALMLVVEAMRLGCTDRRWLSSAAVFLLMLAGTTWYFFLEWPESKGVEESQMVQGFAAKPLTYALFLLRVIAAPMSELLLTMDKEDRNQGMWIVSPWIGAGALLLWTLVLGVLWKRRAELDWPKVVPWLLCGLFGLGNACALAMARAEHPYAIPFECRYPAYTLWLHIGLLALMGHFVLRWQKVICALWVLIPVVWGGSVGALHGFWDAERRHAGGQQIEAAAALRQVAVEPVPLDGVAPSAGERIFTMLDELESLGLLGVKTIKSPLVSEATVVDDPQLWEGQIRSGSLAPTGVYLRGWALNRKTKRTAGAVAISVQPKDGPEQWQGLATRRLRELKLADRKDAREQESRIGWAYEVLTGKETCRFTTIPMNLSRKPLPKGEATFRAYVLDVKTGTFWRLSGEVKLILP